MKRELEYFCIENSYGGNQEWFSSFMMRIGGCAAETVCDLCVYFALYFGEKILYPGSLNPIDQREYIALANRVRPFLGPRPGGVNKLSTYTEGLSRFLSSVGETRLSLSALAGETPEEEAAKAFLSQIDRGYPVPNLTLRHKSPVMNDYTWHWYILNGYDRDETSGRLLVKAVTYGEGKWLDFSTLWNTGYSEKGGLILLDGLQSLPLKTHYG